MLFIDTLQYLDLYRTFEGKKLLGTLAAVKEHVFITAQITDEVTRNKLEVANSFFAEQLKGLNQEFKAIKKGMPDQLFSIDVFNDLKAKLNLVSEHINGMNKAANKAINELLERIGLSQDDVSLGLSVIFDRAVDASAEELDRARARKERGKAPGKVANALGDQINWEQFLTRVHDWPEVWIISRDGDHCQKWSEQAVLNPALYQDLVKKRQDIVVHCFTEIEKGLRHFTEAKAIADAKLPTPEEADLINKEQEALPQSLLPRVPPVSPSMSYSDAFHRFRRRF